MSIFRLIVFTLKLSCRKKTVPLRGGSFLCDQEEGMPAPVPTQGALGAPAYRDVACMDTDSNALLRTVAVKAEGIRTGAQHENLYLTPCPWMMSQRSPLPTGPRGSSGTGFHEVSLGLGLVTCKRRVRGWEAG